jgi:trk system potassium uptake protein
MSKKLASGYRLIFGYLGYFLVLIGIICILPLFMLVAYPNEVNVIWSFLIPGLTSIVIGFALSFFIFKREKCQLGKFQDSVLLVALWILAILVGAVPFFLRGMGTSYFGTTSVTDAIFESTSGYSSTGLTLFEFSADAPGFHIYTTYRSLLLLFGGIGLVLIVTSALSDRYGLKLYTAEGHNDKLMPNLAKSARLILAIYLGYILLGTLSYWLIGGMELFDSFNHAIAAVATGGFSTKSGGLPDIIAAGGVNSVTGIPINGVAINITSIVLMVLGATNFVLHLFLFQGKFKKIIKDCEIRFMGLMILIFVPLFVISIFTTKDSSGNQIYDFATSFEDGAYTFFTSITTTGFSTVHDIKALGETTVILSVIMMCVGGGMGSTAGAVKQYRVVVAFKSFYWSIRDHLSPRGVMYPHYVTRLGEEHDVSKSETFEAYGYTLLYVTVLLGGTVLICIFGQDSIIASDALFEFASALSGTGLSVGITGLRNVGVNWVLIGGMFAGRLEILCIYFAFYRVIRDIFRKETV